MVLLTEGTLTKTDDMNSFGDKVTLRCSCILKLKLRCKSYYGYVK